jgi:hypothetical protein
MAEKRERTTEAQSVNLRKAGREGGREGERGEGG